MTLNNCLVIKMKKYIYCPNCGEPKFKVSEIKKDGWLRHGKCENCKEAYFISGMK